MVQLPFLRNEVRLGFGQCGVRGVPCRQVKLRVRLLGDRIPRQILLSFLVDYHKSFLLESAIQKLSTLQDLVQGTKPAPKEPRQNPPKINVFKSQDRFIRNMASPWVLKGRYPLKPLISLWLLWSIRGA